MLNKLLHEHIDSLEEELEVTKRAFRMMCSDYYSLRYPNISRSVDDIYNGYMDEAREELAAKNC